jgi:2'-5' RNA ligase
MPHINLLFPFVSIEEFPRMAVRLQRGLSSFQKFDLSLDNLGSFKQSKGETYHLKPSSQEGRRMLQRLFDLVRSILPEVKSKHSEFNPHLTIGQDSIRLKIEAIKESFAESPITFTVDGLALLSRSRTDSTVPFRIVDRVKFGAEVLPKSVPRSETVAPVVPSGACLRAHVCDLGDGLLLKLKALSSESQASRPVLSVLVVDNSGSMGRHARELTRSIGRGMFELSRSGIDLLPGIVVVFSDHAKVVFNNLADPSDLDHIDWPGQGCTNITSGMEAALSEIKQKFLYKQIPRETHVIVTLLSDGQHNSGTSPEKSLPDWHRSLKEIDCSLSLLTVAISPSSDVRLSMKIKQSLENVPIPGLQSVYYADNHYQMSTVTRELQVGCAQNLGGGTFNLKLASPRTFLDTGTSEMRVFLRQGQEGIYLVETPTSELTVLSVDGVEHSVEPTELSASDLSHLLDSSLPRLSQRVVAKGLSSVQRELQVLERVIGATERLLLTQGSSSQPSLDISKLTPSRRRELLRQFRRSQVSFQTERNRLRELQVTTTNDSQQQADYLNGMDRKYAGKAVVRAGTSQVSTEEVRRQLLKLRDSLREAVKSDESNPIGAAPSMISYQTPRQQMSEWLESLDNLAHPSEEGTIYDLLVDFSLPAIPIEMEHNNAVQMDPYQTSCRSVDVCAVDTGSFLLAQQLGREVLTPSRRPIRDVLVLIDPSCPASSRVGYWSPVNEYLTSITLCRDLYMYSGPKMMASLHAHAFLRTLEQFGENRSEAYLDLAFRILYSIRAQWGTRIGGLELLKHWYEGWNGLTQAERDNCQHPVQLILLLSAVDFGEVGLALQSSPDPLVNLLNEVLARRAKTVLRGICGTSGVSDRDLRRKAGEMLSKTFGITPENSPSPNPDVSVSEPSEESIRETIPRGRRFLPEASDPDRGKWMGGVQRPLDYVNSITQPYVLAYQFGHRLQEYFSQNGYSWTTLEGDMECGDPENRFQRLKTHLKSKVDDLKPPPEELQSELVAETMVAQAFCYPTSGLRESITEQSVLDAETLYNLTTELHMDFYRQANAQKRQKWLDCIGSMTAEQALIADLPTYVGMCGQHTHGFNREVFWGLAKAAHFDRDKREAFEKHSNQTTREAGFWAKVHKKLGVGGT